MLNSVLEHQLPIAQAAEIIGVSNATPSVSSKLTAGTVPLHWPTATGTEDLTTPSLRRPLLPW